MNRDTCEHDWKIQWPTVRNENGYFPATCICQKCGLVLSVSDSLQLKAVENQTTEVNHLIGFQKKYNIVALIISISAIIISIIALILKS